MKYNSYQTIKKNGKKSRKGSVLAFSMTIVIVLTIIGLGLLQLALHAQLMTIRTTAQIAARTAADAGHSMAYFKLEKMVDDNGSQLPQQSTSVSLLGGSDQSYTFTITDANSGDGYDVIAVGTFGNAQRTVESRALTKGIFDHAIFAEDKIQLHNAMEVDGYNSDDGNYGSGNQGSSSIGTNSTEEKAIEMTNSAQVVGDAIIGPGGDVSDAIYLSNSAEITGAKSAAKEEKELPQVTAPGLPNRGDIELDNKNKTQTISENGKYGKLLLSNQSTLYIAGDVVLHVTDYMEIDNNCELVINSGSSLVLYLDGHFKISNTGAINNVTKKPPMFQLYSTATSSVDFVFDNNTDFYGSVYAPNGDIEIKNSAEFYGSIIGNTVKVDNNAEIHYDQALQKILTLGAELVTTRWKEY